MPDGEHKLTQRGEDYLEAVGVLVRRGGVARVRDIAALTKVSMSTVTASLKQLASAGLVNYDPYELVTLTPRGQKLAATICDRHLALAAFLTEVLRVEPPVAEENACRMEHVVDDRVLGRLSLLAEFLREHPASGEVLQRFWKFCGRRESAAGVQEEKR